MKPLKRNIQIAINGKRKNKTSGSGSKSKRSSERKPSNGDAKKPGVLYTNEEGVKDSIVSVKQQGSLALVDTVIKLYYLNLTDSVLDTYKTIIRSFIARTGINKLSEVSLTDVYLNISGDQASILLSKKEDLWEIINKAGVSKHHIFMRRSRRINTAPQNNSKRLLYLEITFH